MLWSPSKNSSATSTRVTRSSLTRCPTTTMSTTAAAGRDRSTSPTVLTSPSAPKGQEREEKPPFNFHHVRGVSVLHTHSHLPWGVSGAWPCHSDQVSGTRVSLSLFSYSPPLTFSLSLYLCLSLFSLLSSATRGRRTATTTTTTIVTITTTTMTTTKLTDDTVRLNFITIGSDCFWRRLWIDDTRRNCYILVCCWYVELLTWRTIVVNVIGRPTDCCWRLTTSRELRYRTVTTKTCAGLMLLALPYLSSSSSSSTRSSTSSSITTFSFSSHHHLIYNYLLKERIDKKRSTYTHMQHDRTRRLDWSGHALARTLCVHHPSGAIGAIPATRATATGLALSQHLHHYHMYATEIICVQWLFIFKPGWKNRITIVTYDLFINKP